MIDEVTEYRGVKVYHDTNRDHYCMAADTYPDNRARFLSLDDLHEYIDEKLKNWYVVYSEYDHPDIKEKVVKYHEYVATVLKDDAAWYPRKADIYVEFDGTESARTLQCLNHWVINMCAHEVLREGMPWNANVVIHAVNIPEVLQDNWKKAFKPPERSEKKSKCLCSIVECEIEERE